MFFKYKNIVITYVIIYNYIWRTILVLNFFDEFDNDDFISETTINNNENRPKMNKL